MLMAESNDSEFHEKELNRHCRVCAGVVENTYTYTCHEETNKTLQKKFGIDVDKDQPNIHPKVYFARAAARRPLSIQCTESALKVFQWTPLTDPALVVRSVVFSKKNRKREGDQGRRGRIVDGCAPNLL